MRHKFYHFTAMVCLVLLLLPVLACRSDAIDVATSYQGKILKSDTLVAKNYLNEKELSRLNRLVTMFIDYAELMAEDEQPMSMEDWLHETDRFLTNNRRNVLESKGHISREAAVKKVSDIYAQFRKKQDADYISEFDRVMERYLKGGGNP